ncbi:MAG: ATP-binding cassette domain-containing protein [Eubacteriales bacterium]
MDKIITVKNLKKYYGEVKAVNGIDFYVEKGKMFALLGPNGAGKSTTIDIICTLLKQNTGEVIINGYKLGQEDGKIRESIGVVFQDGVLDPLLTVRENLTTRAKFYPIEKSKLKNAVANAANITESAEFIDRPYGKLSGGQKRRADIARALVNTPKILFLDEPTTGLDPQTRKSVWDTISKLQKETGMTVFFTTHYMEEAAAADFIIIIDHGTISAKGTPYELKEKFSSDLLKIKATDTSALKDLLNSKNIKFDLEDEFAVVKIEQTREALPILKAAEPYIESFEVIRGTMDDVFINVVSQEGNNDD